MNLEEELSRLVEFPELSKDKTIFSTPIRKITQEVPAEEQPISPKLAEQLDELDGVGTQEPTAADHFLDVMAEFEGVKRHEGAEAHDKDTHGYGLKESTRKTLGIPMNEDPRVMARQAYDHFYNKAKKKVKDLDSMDNEAKTFLTSSVWNTGMVFGSAKRIAEGKKFKLGDVKEYVSNMRTGDKNLAGLGNRRAKDYNVLAEGRGWPTIDKIEWTTKGGTFTFSNGKTAKIDKKVEPTKHTEVNL